MPMPTAEFIDRLARCTDDVEKHGDVMHCRPYSGGALHNGSYLVTRLYETRFEDGTIAHYFVQLGAPVKVTAWYADEPPKEVGDWFKQFGFTRLDDMEFSFRLRLTYCHYCGMTNIAMSHEPKGYICCEFAGSVDDLRLEPWQTASAAA
jgi:hypothetical protein